MNMNLIRKSCSVLIVASSFLVLTACGGGGGDDSTPAAAVGSAAWVAEQQAILDAASSISAFDDVMFDAIEACGVVGAIDEVAEIACVQEALDAIDPPTSI